MTSGNTTGYDVKLDLRFLFSKQWSLLGSFMGPLGELHEVLKFVFRKEIKPVIDKVYPLTEIRAAHEHLENAATYAAQNDQSLDLFAEELRLTQDRLNSITGEFTSDDLLGVIFSRFCIGK